MITEFDVTVADLEHLGSCAAAEPLINFLKTYWGAGIGDRLHTARVGTIRVYQDEAGFLAATFVTRFKVPPGEVLE